MNGFLAGMAVGCLIGAVVAFVFLVIAAFWFGEPGGSRPLSRLDLVPFAGILAIGALSYGLHLPKAAVMILLLSAVFLTADQADVLIAFVASAFSAIVLTFLFLPPLRSFRVVHSEDWVALAVFFLVSVSGSRLIHGRKTGMAAAESAAPARSTVQTGD